MRKLLAVEGNYKNYRLVQETVEPPAIPYLGKKTFHSGVE